MSDLTGFKETEIGAIPAEWEVVRLGELARVNYGKAKPTSEGLMPVVGSGGIYGWADEALIDFPTLVIGRKGTAGRAWLMDKPCWPSDTTFYLEWTQEVDIHFLFGYLTLNPLSGEHAKTTLPSLSRPDLENYLIPFPPLPEQRRIAHVLSTIQGAIAAQDDLIAAAREVKRSLMQRLFTYGPGPEPAPTKETEIGEIPAHWEVCPLGDLLAINLRNGIYKPRDLYGKGHIRIVQLNDIYSPDARIRPNQLDTVDVTDAEWEKYKIIDGDLIVNRVSKREEGVGAVALVEPSDLPTVFESNMFRVRLDQSRILREYFLQYGQSDIYHRQVMLRATKANQTSINQGSLRAIPVPTPRPNIQQTVAEMLNAADRKIAAEGQRKAALQALFKTMLHQLMTGQIRMNAGADSHCMPL